MPTIEQASVQDVTRLLSLFPVSQIKHVWNLRGKKDEICAVVAAQPEARGQVETFIDSHFSCCKQHVYVFEQPVGAAPPFPADIGDAEKVREVAGEHALYIVRTQFDVVLSEPFERASVEFLWPFRLDMTPRNLTVRFVALEKNLSAYFDRAYYGTTRTIDEEDVLSDMLQTYGYPLTDLHRGVKAAWHADFMDAIRVRYKKPTSTASEEMDEERGIKAFDAELYEELRPAALFQTVFRVAPAEELSVSALTVKPAEGYLAFPRYSEQVGDTDAVIREILNRNQ